MIIPRYYLLLLVALLSSLSATTPSKKKILRAYKHGKMQYKTGAYQEAKKTFSTLIHTPAAHYIQPYAHFYYALAAYYNQEPEQAEATLTHILKQFPTWEQVGEVLYWLGQLRFEAADPTTALSYLKTLTNKAFEKPVQHMKAHFLDRITHVPTLQILFQHDPTDPILAETLYRKIAEQPFIQRDFALMEKLEQDFNLSKAAYDPLQDLSSPQKTDYQVAVLLPFCIAEDDEKNTAVLDLYEGIRAAVAVLADEGITIHLQAYDTQKQEAVTADLLAQEELQSVDLIIGPLYSHTHPLVAHFAQTHHINLFSPLSYNADVVGDNPFVFLAQPSLETQAKQAAAFTLQHTTDPMHIGIFYSLDPEDNRKAQTYKQYIEQHAPQAQLTLFPLTPTEAQQFLNAFRTTETEAEAEADLLKSLTHLYVASDDALMVSNVLSVIDMLQLTPLMIGSEQWLHQNTISLDQLQTLPLYLVAPGYIAYEKPSVQAFRQLFFHQTAHYPTKFAYQGYELMLFLGRRLAHQGVYFQKQWGDDTYPGAIFSGFRYGKCHDNQQVPIVKWQDGALVLCNTPTPEDPS